MRQQKHFPAYLPETDISKNTRASLMLTYEQIISTASALLVIMEQSEKLFKKIYLTAYEKSIIQSTHNACINCALSLEEYARVKNAQE
jgi:hypothetical protein